MQFGPTQSMACEKVESFGLAEQNIRRLKFGAFQNEFYVYLGNVNSAGGTNTLYLLTSSSPNSWPESGEPQEKAFQRRFIKHQEWKTDFSFQRSGDSVDFRAEGRTFRLTISSIYSALIGPNSVAIEICEERRKASGPKVQRGL